MNNRDYKQFVPGLTYHIYNRGVGKMDIFLDREDHFFFLTRLKESLYPCRTVKPASRRYIPTTLPEDAFRLFLYVLMPNHFHLCLMQNTELPVSALISKVCTSYSKYFNKKYARVGSLFQDQFKAVPVESNEQLLWLTAYIHRNPLRSGLVQTLDEYPYSSHLDYLGKRSGTLCHRDFILRQYASVDEYRSAVMEQDGTIEEYLSDEIRFD